MQRMNLLTNETVTLVSKRNPGALSLDRINKRVYWQDENRGIFSISYDGLNKTTTKNGSFNSRLLGILAGSAYFQEVNAPYINQMKISSGEISLSLKLNETDYLDLVVVHSSLQPMGELKDHTILYDTSNVQMPATNLIILESRDSVSRRDWISSMHRNLANIVINTSGCMHAC